MHISWSHRYIQTHTSHRYTGRHKHHTSITYITQSMCYTEHPPTGTHYTCQTRHPSYTDTLIIIIHRHTQITHITYRHITHTHHTSPITHREHPPIDPDTHKRYYTYDHTTHRPMAQTHIAHTPDHTHTHTSHRYTHITVISRTSHISHSSCITHTEHPPYTDTHITDITPSHIAYTDTHHTHTPLKTSPSPPGWLMSSSPPPPPGPQGKQPRHRFQPCDQPRDQPWSCPWWAAWWSWVNSYSSL